MKFRTVAAVFILALAAGTGVSAWSAVQQPSNLTRDFIQKAAIGTEFEIRSSNVALGKSNNPNVRDFAQHMIDDHGKSGDRFQTVVTMQHLRAELPDGLDAKHQKLLNDLQAASSANVDGMYIRDQANAHEEAITAFREYAAKGDDGALQQFASETLPTLEEHRQKIMALETTQ